mmetsp:Transcript_32361/g.75123  ORF Transcript_32361/g.75123 Transcript_32361/m.75123 type:complete len:253 (-) Transcript_32361:104-862(-)|eukprot:CAMPEP_0171090054 /NCGR_PEP_ID=MMETSP0766_2-20121228/28543_1 /TAXON_ID=439317 /ORGANISM="Gambierdiscus australes, Strain CAWD 149" /LENGTH=252 /DNA_ID=CAMNT_0011548001 /DNA_START=50 /DNA_END=808 /DNA_ORIENTATION=+
MSNESQAAIKKVLRNGDDYYGILGVDKQADEETLKKAYRKLALRLHPDKCKDEGAEDAFKKVGEAFSVLSDPEKRRRYDQFGISALREGGGPGGPGGVSPEDIFEHFFGGHGSPFAQGPTFVHTAGQGGFQTFRFTTSGGGPANFVQFSTGGPRQRRGTPGQRQGGQAEREEEEERIPEWLRHLQVVAASLGSLMPVVCLGVMMLLLALAGKILQFIMSRVFFIFPILYFTEGRTKNILLSAVLLLAFFGVL